VASSAIDHSSQGHLLLLLLLLLLLQVVQHLMSDPLIDVNRRTAPSGTALFLTRCSMIGVRMAEEDRFLLRLSVASSAVDHSP
jgi:hypothetical protein